MAFEVYVGGRALHAYSLRVLVLALEAKGLKLRNDMVDKNQSGKRLEVPGMSTGHKQDIQPS